MLNLYPNLKKLFLITIFSLATSVFVMAQTKVSGMISDARTKEPLVGVSVQIKGKIIGTITDLNGKFDFTTATPVPFQLVISSVGYKSQEYTVKSENAAINISLEEENIMGQELVVSASRMEESVMKSSASIEKMDLKQIQQSAAPSFYDALSNMKGVEMSTQSLTFKSVNTRGFNSNGNVRMVQLVDGMDNQAPGLNFPVGNIAGITELDLESAELIPGAASALYGPNAINGILLLNSKSPFLYQGLSASAKGGMMHFDDPSGLKPSPFTDLSLRYAKAFNNKFAFKLNLGFLTAKDWTASNFLDLNANLNSSSTRNNNPNYNGVNVYGDETAFNIRDIANNMVKAGAITPDLVSFVPNVNVSRTGWTEQQITTPDTRNIKLSGALHYRLNEKMELIAQANYGLGNTVYTGADRYSIKNFNIGQYKLELKGDNFFLRGYTTQERSGDSYASGTLGQLINEGWGGGSGVWFPTYVGAFLGAKKTGADDAAAHIEARKVADAKRPVAGSTEFNKIADSFKVIDIPKGAHFNDKTNLYHYEGMYNFKNQIKFADVIVGASHRIFQLNSNGTIFADKEGRKISIKEYGAYTQIAKQFGTFLKLTGSMRYDKSQNFDGQFTPRISSVVTFAKDHNIRLSYQTAFRIPTTQDQYIDLKVPQAQLIGGLEEFKNTYNLINNPVYSLGNVLVYGAEVQKLAATPAVQQQAIGLITTTVTNAVTAQVNTPANIAAITTAVTPLVTQAVVQEVVNGAVLQGLIPNTPEAIAASIQAGIAGQLPSPIQSVINSNISSEIPKQVQGQITKLISENVAKNLPKAISDNLVNTITAIAGAGAKSKLSQYQFRQWVPEKVASYEIGYKGLIGKKLFLDAYYYYNEYKNFSTSARVIQVTDAGKTALASLGVDPVVGLLSSQYRQVYSLPTSSTGKTITSGWGLGLDYSLPKGFNIGGNISENHLTTADESIIADGNQISYNTPKYRYNVSLGNKNVANSGWGFYIVMRHQDSFIWNSSFVNTPDPDAPVVPKNNIVDLQINKRIPSMRTMIKIGASNLFNSYYISSYGNPSVGGQYYVSLLFDNLLKN
ncbi:MAG: TonB-dependent receptor [Cytophagaceae bacterium]|nr:TonB-dependent receptor [Cytophagaceae bacterium]